LDVVGSRYGCRPSAIVGLEQPMTALFFDYLVALRSMRAAQRDPRYDDDGECLDFSPVKH